MVGVVLGMLDTKWREEGTARGTDTELVADKQTDMMLRGMDR